MAAQWLVRERTFLHIGHDYMIELETLCKLHIEQYDTRLGQCAIFAHCLDGQWNKRHRRQRFSASTAMSMT